MGAQASFAEGMKAAKEVQKDLQWTQKRVEYVEDSVLSTTQN
jgi:exonuclease VII small subunit